MGIIRILLIADTHLGFDLPFQPRIIRRRRGHDFFSNFERALAPALKGKVDCVVHGGDILYRSKVPAQLVDMAFKPLKKWQILAYRCMWCRAIMSVHPYPAGYSRITRASIFSAARRPLRFRKTGIDWHLPDFPISGIT